jgi:hypothetical protein
MRHVFTECELQIVCKKLTMTMAHSKTGILKPDRISDKV